MIAKWGLDTKNIRESDMKFVLAKQQKRKLEEGKDTEFEINGKPVPTRKMQRFLQRKDISQEELHLSQDCKRSRILRGEVHLILIQLKATPPHISYHTPFPTAEVPCNITVTSAASPFERWSQRYDLSESPNWVRDYMTPRNPLSIISPAPIGTPWNDDYPEPSRDCGDVVPTESESDLIVDATTDTTSNADDE
jgi:hypothetical protein